MDLLLPVQAHKCAQLAQLQLQVLGPAAVGMCCQKVWLDPRNFECVIMYEQLTAATTSGCQRISWTVAGQWLQLLQCRNA